MKKQIKTVPHGPVKPIASPAAPSAHEIEGAGAERRLVSPV